MVRYYSVSLLLLELDKYLFFFKKNIKIKYTYKGLKTHTYSKYFKFNILKQWVNLKKIKYFSVFLFTRIKLFSKKKRRQIINRVKVYKLSTVVDFNNFLFL